MESGLEREKELAAAAAAELVENGMAVGLGTGSTVAHLLPALAARNLEIRCVATSPATEAAARELGLELDPFTELQALDIAIDGADQIDADGWLVKGGGGAHTREKIVARSAERFVVIADSSKLVEEVRAPVPLELLRFGLASTLRELGKAAVRDAPPSPDGNLIADYTGAVNEAAPTAEWLDAVPGVVEHGLFAPSLVAELLIGRGDGVERRVPGSAA